VPISAFLWHTSTANKKKMEVWMNTDLPKKKLRWLCMNVESFSYETYLDMVVVFLKKYKTFVVVDEATCIKNPDAKRTVNIINGLSRCTMQGKRIVKRVPYSVKRSILTGTPETKGPYGLWSMFEFLEHNYFGMNYYAFKAHYGMEKQVFFPGMNRPVQKALEPSDFRSIRKQSGEGFSVENIAGSMSLRIDDVQYIIDNPDVMTPYKNLSELKDKIAKKAFIVKKEDCLDLPPKIYERIIVEMSTEQKAIYKSMIAQAFAVYQKHELTAVNKVSIQTRLRQIAGGFFPATYEQMDGLGLTVKLDEVLTKPIGIPAKATAILADLEEVSLFPVIIATAFRAEAQYMYDACTKSGYKAVMITGDVTKGSRADAVEAYKSGDADVLIATTQTIARGYNFQNGSIMYIYSSSYNTEDRLQLEDRMHRIGQKAESVVYKDVMTKGTLDETVLEVINGDRAFLEYMRSDDPSDFFKLIGADIKTKVMEVTAYE